MPRDGQMGGTVVVVSLALCFIAKNNIYALQNTQFLEEDRIHRNPPVLNIFSEEVREIRTREFKEDGFPTLL
jgi:hypothetical protein